MPSLRDIRRRIGSVKSTQQITKAMKMVAAAKLRRAQEAITRARPYATLLEQALVRVASRAAGDGDAAGHPLLAGRPMKKVELVVITSDRGLAGGFNANIVRRAQRFAVENDGKFEEILVSTIGRKGRDAARARKVPVRKDYAGLLSRLDFIKAKDVAEEFSQRFLDGEVDGVFLLYTEFKSAISQRVVLKQLLPIETGPAEESGGASVDFLYEPSREKLLADLVPRHIAVQVWRALLDSAASEHGARMTAMEAATKNAGELIGSLTLQYNRARQAYITKELMEIVSGAEALK